MTTFSEFVAGPELEKMISSKKYPKYLLSINYDLVQNKEKKIPLIIKYNVYKFQRK